MPSFLLLTIIISLIAISAVILVYVFLVLSFNDFSPEDLKLNFRGKNILFIYPHPDDETMASGGLTFHLSKRNNVKVVSVTSGQYGDEILKLPPEKLAEIRKKEFIRAVMNLGVKDYEIWDFTDGKLKQQTSEVKSQIEKIISDFKPDLVVTYEKYGVYGHPDHIALSKIINELSNHANFRTLYSTISQKLFNKIDLPTFMAENKISPSLPKYKFNTLKFARVKYFAAKSHKSQNLSRGHFLSLQMLVNINEYYTDVWDESLPT